MEQRTMHCSGCDRDVRVVITDQPLDDAQASIGDAELICLEVGESCNGSLCPLGAAEPHAMVRRLIHAGIPLGRLTLVRGFCETCGLVTELALYGGHHAACTVCGSSTTRPSRGPA